ncbi:SRPBCC family protein [Rufibacter psychrotolerans]|uniref:SRPBCC family protein n=1 Tax=Rufibacter psychrotolerans TaxID=2812556 RepID=UPI001967E8FE|nr:SRPBCC family protein [Rufibacter sp. SYSU D00308]
MPIINLSTTIQAPPAVCFDLSRSVDLHQVSTAQTEEKAIKGVVAGLMELGDSVTWEAKHLCVRQKLSSHITAFERPYFFADEMLTGAFKSFRHEHRFEAIAGEATRMTDVFQFTSPLGILGKLADILFLKQYMTHLLLERNRVIKEVAESGKWQEVLAIEKRVVL